MLDYHLHLWPHGTPASQPTLDELAAYCEKAATAGVGEIALTEHLFRFRQADTALAGFWNDDPNPALRASLARRVFKLGIRGPASLLALHPRPRAGCLPRLESAEPYFENTP